MSGINEVPLRDDQRLVLLHSEVLSPVTWRDYVDSNKSGIRLTSESPLTQDPFFAGFEAKVIADTGYDPQTDEITARYIDRGEIKYIHRSGLMMWRTVLLGLQKLGLLDEKTAKLISEIDRSRVGLIVGTAFSGTDHLTEVNVERVRPSDPLNTLIARVATAPGMELGINGPVMQLGTECASGATGADVAIGYLTTYRDDLPPRADLMIVGGVDAPITKINAGTFVRGVKRSATSNDDPRTASRPLDKAADGLVMGEGAGALFLATVAGARKMGFTAKHIKAELVGYSTLTHAESRVFAGHEGTVRLISQVLKMANIQPHEITYINPHATSTAGGDSREIRALAEAVDQRGLKRRNVWVGPTKGATGHDMGAVGAIEAHFTENALNENTIPPALNLENPIEDTDGFSLGIPRGKIILPAIDVAVSISLGFGGTGTALAFRKFKP